MPEPGPTDQTVRNEMQTDLPSGRELFRILYLEDDLGLSDDLRATIPHLLPGTAVHWAGTIVDGLELLAQETEYTLGLLDVRVPFRANKQPEAHPDVANALRERGVALLIYTGYLQTPDVQQYLSQRLTDPPLAVIAKKVGNGLTDEIVKTIREWFVQVASQRIGLAFSQLFERPWESGFSFRGTGAVLSLQQDIIDYWAYLDSDARDLIATRFHVQIADRNIVDLTLIPSTD